MGFLNPRVWIGGRPVRDAYNEAQALSGVHPQSEMVAGQKALQIAEAGGKAGINMALHPLFSGPASRMAFAAVGAAPWVTNLTDPTMGNPTFQLHTDRTANPGILGWASRTTMRELNQISPSAQLLAEQSSDLLTGTPWSGPERPGDPAKIFQTLNDILIPRSRIHAVSPQENADRATQRLKARVGYFAKQEARKKLAQQSK